MHLWDTGERAGGGGGGRTKRDPQSVHPANANLFSSLLLQGYSTLPGYGNGKEAVRPITIWKGNSYTTISARDPAFSGKDSGKGDSDFNDSDSDVSGDTGLKKDGAGAPPMAGQNGKGRN